MFGRFGLHRPRRRHLGFALLVLVGLGGGLCVYLKTPPTELVVHALEHWKDKRDLGRVIQHRDRLVRSALEAGVDPYVLAGILWSESRGVSGQTSSAGALGLMQLSEAAAGDAARALGLPEPSKQDLLHNEDLNVRLGAQHLKWLLESRGDWSLEAVLVSYNAGRSKLKRWIEESGSYVAWCQSEERAKAQGRKTTGALAYARRSLEVAEALRATGALKVPAGVGKP